jgi:FMN phosphatase YigB (HAD superfamily)
MISSPAIVFDLGKVLVDFDYRILVHRLAQRCGRTPREIATLVEQSPLLSAYESGQINTGAFFQQVQAASGFPGNLEEFADLFGDIFTEIEPMTAMHSQLHAAGFPTFIFSNTNELAVRWITRRFPFFSRFDGYVYSFEHRVQKPDPQLYEVVESKAARRGADLIYIDDREENIDAGQARGWRVVLQENPAKTRARVGEMTGLSFV